MKTYTKEQKKTAKDKLKAVGYKLSISTKHSPFDGTAFEFIYLVLPDGTKILCSDVQALSVAFYGEHKAAFNIINEVFNQKEIEKT